MKIKLFMDTSALWIRWMRMLRTMRNVILMIILFGYQASAGVFSQSKVNLELKNASFKDLVDVIVEQTDLGFWYDTAQLRELDDININVENLSVEEVLDQVFENTDFAYEVEHKTILIIKRPALHIQEKQKEKKSIKGKVTDKDGIPLPGVSVVIKGTNIGVATNIDGEYLLKTEDENITLVYSFVGMTSKEITYQGQESINVMLSEDEETLGEVVITGYTKISKERATGSFVNVDNEIIEKQVTNNLIEKFEGVATGLLTTTTNGDGGNKTKLVIRGQGTFKADEEPLIVLDGFPYEGSIDDINPNDVDKINVLQDAAAASIWGVKAANGVIVINTKKGVSGKPRVEYNASFSFEKEPDLNDLQLASSKDIVDYQLKVIDAGLDATVNNYIADEDKRSAALNGVQQAYADYKIGKISETDYNTLLNQLRNTNGFKEYSDEFLQTAFTQQHNLSVRGGSENYKYYFSTNYLDSESVEKGDAKQRIAVRLNNDFNLSEKLSASIGVNYTHSKNEYNAVGLNLYTHGSIERYQSLRDKDGNLTRVPKGVNDNVKKEYEDKGYLNWGYNPIQEAALKDYTSTSSRVDIRAGLKYDILSYLNWEVKGQYTKQHSKTRNLQPQDAYDVRSNINVYTLYNEKLDEYTYQWPLGGVLDQSKSEMESYTLRTQFNFDKTFVEQHQVTISGGMELRETLNEGTTHRYFGYDDDYLLYDKQMNWKELSRRVETYNGNKTGSIVDPSSMNYHKSRFASTFLNGAYTYDHRYTFSLSGKIDQTNMFGVDARLKKNPLWSVGLGWNITNENFFDSKVVNSLKLRMSYGVNGNIHSNATTATTLRIFRDWSTNQNAFRFDSYGNPNLTYEDTKTTNIALDFGLFNFRLNGSIDYYFKSSENLLSQFEVNSTYGFNGQFKNLGKIENSGIDISLNGDIIDKEDFKWNSILNFSYNKNKVVVFENTSQNASSLVGSSYIEGKSLSTIHAYRWAGLDEKGMPQIYDADGNKVGINENMEDFNGLKDVGQTSPPFYGGFINSFSYKNLSLSVMMSYKFGHIFRRPSFIGSSSRAYHKDLTKMWTSENTNTNVPGMPETILGGSMRNNYRSYYLASDELIEDASHIRLRQISLNYHVGRESLQAINLPLESLEFSAQVRNLGLLWKANKHDIDPESIPLAGGAGAVDGQTLVVSRPGIKVKPIFTFGINVKF